MLSQLLYLHSLASVFNSLLNRIFLEHEGASFIEWKFPDVCTAEDKNSKIINIAAIAKF